MKNNVERERGRERARAREGKQYVKIKLVNTAKQPNKAPITWCVLVNARARARKTEERGHCSWLENM